MLNTSLDALIVLVVNNGDGKIYYFSRNARFLFMCICMYTHT